MLEVYVVEYRHEEDVVPKTWASGILGVKQWSKWGISSIHESKRLAEATAADNQDSADKDNEDTKKTHPHYKQNKWEYRARPYTPKEGV